MTTEEIAADAAPNPISSTADRLNAAPPLATVPPNAADSAPPMVKPVAPCAVSATLAIAPAVSTATATPMIASRIMPKMPQAGFGGFAAGGLTSPIARAGS